MDRAVTVGTPTEPQPLEPIWAVAFDDQGVVRDRWRGPVALEVLAAKPS